MGAGENTETSEWLASSETLNPGNYQYRMHFPVINFINREISPLFFRLRQHLHAEGQDDMQGTEFRFRSFGIR